MKIINIKNAQNILACMIAVQFTATHMSVPPFIEPEKQDFATQLLYEEQVYTRKLTKKDRSNYDNRFHRNARSSLGKPNYYSKRKDF